MRDAQLLWIPSAGLEALAAHSPRAFVSLAWRMGSRARGRSGSSSSPGGGQLNKKGADGLFSAAGISGTHSNHPGLGVHKGGQIGATLDETPVRAQDRRGGPGVRGRRARARRIRRRRSRRVVADVRREGGGQRASPRGGWPGGRRSIGERGNRALVSLFISEFLFISVMAM